MMLKNLVVDDHGGVVVGVLPDDGLGVEVTGLCTAWLFVCCVDCVVFVVQLHPGISVGLCYHIEEEERF